jgi:DNA-binding NarL/FixJ family response regulator
MTPADRVSLPVSQIAVPKRAVLKRSKTFKKRFSALTERRQQVAVLAGRGLSNRAIAEEFSLNENSVKNHLHKIYQKLHVRRRIALMIDYPKSARLAVLTDRQRQVATLVCRGLLNREIAEKLVVSEGTIKIHLHGSYKKLDVHSRNALANALAH